MRWQQQTIEAESATRLPGLGATNVRTFKAPDSLDVRLHEVHARSALNRVPGDNTRLPFRWTVNPYRGCFHACTYCADGSTRVLMGDGTTRELRDLRTGDVIYGTRVEGGHRRYARTEVLDHWSSIKPAYRVVLADGTELVASGDHRFLTDRHGWRHVSGSMAGTARRPYLTASDALVGFGATAAPPVESADYRRGYLTGLIRGGGRSGSDRYEGVRPERGDVHPVRLAVADGEPLERCERYLVAGVGVAALLPSAGDGTRPALRAISAPSCEVVAAITRMPLSPSDDWRKGLLAAILDAEESCWGALRIPADDPALVAWTMDCLRHFGLRSLPEHGTDDGLATIRLRGGLREHMRFLHLTEPATARKRDIEGQTVRSDAELQVVAVEPLAGSMRLYDITTGTGDFIANGVVSHNCFARPTHEFLDFNAGEDFVRELVVKVNVPEVLRVELAKPGWRREHVALGTNTDPYQWVEKRYRLMRGIWEAMRDFANPCSILTKSPLLLRDLDLLLEIAEVAEVSACLSIPTLEEKAWRASEPHTPHPKARLEAVAALNEAGIPTGVLVAPLMPGINDSPEEIERVLDACFEAGAVRVGGQALFLRGSTKQVFMDWLREDRPKLVAEYERLYGRRAYLSREDRERVERPLRLGVQRRMKERERRGDALAERFKRSAAEVATGRDDAPFALARPPQPRVVQESLF